jgi:hypothetical protein
VIVIVIVVAFKDDALFSMDVIAVLAMFAVAGEEKSQLDEEGEKEGEI